MKNYIPLLLLAGCASGQLPPENYDVVITESKRHEVIIPAADPSADKAMPPIHTWMMPSDIETLQRSNLDAALDSSMRCDCANGDPLCPCIVK